MRYENIIQVLQLKDYHVVNKHLDIGWILINTYVDEYGVSPNYTDRTHYYVLGWNKSNGKIQYPAEVEIDDMFANWAKSHSDNHTQNSLNDDLPL